MNGNLSQVLFILFSCLVQPLAAQVHGTVMDQATKEQLVGVSVRGKSSTITNRYGFFSLPGQMGDTLRFTAVGYEPYVWVVDSVHLIRTSTIFLVPAVTDLEEATVKANKETIFSFQNPKITLTSAQINRMTLLMGEKDPLKALQLLPGVQEVNEGSSGLSVRGGDLDQNLLLLDEGVVYNANHLFGFFSTFHPDPIQQVDLYKSFFPARYGGRLSSVVDVKLKEGNKYAWKGKGSIGLLSSRFHLEGPLKKEKASLVLSARRTYLDALLVPLQSAREKTGYYFGDFNLKTNIELSPKQSLYASYYFGRDVFYQRNRIPRRENFLLQETNLAWGNQTAMLRWNRIASQKRFQHVSLLWTNYQLKFGESLRQDYLVPPRFENSNLTSTIRDIAIKADWEWFISPQLTLEYGAQVTQHRIAPQAFLYTSSLPGTERLESNSDTLRPVESAGYIHLTGEKGKLFYQAGVRLSQFGSKLYPEPRILVGIKNQPWGEVHGGYSRMNQFLHLISQTGSGLPTDVWVPSGSGLVPSQADMLNISWRLPTAMSWTVQLESYYRWIRGNTFNRSGVSFLGITEGGVATFDWRESLIQGKSWQYGYEVSVQKQSGKWTAFGGYTLGWAIAQFDELNEGRPFYANQDRRHTVEISTLYQLNKRWDLSLNVMYRSGQMLTLPNAFFFRQDRFFNILESYSGPNQFRTEGYFRLDLGATLKRPKATWEFSVYNATNRRNPFAYVPVRQNDTSQRVSTMQLRRQALLPILPSITYNFSF